MVSYTRFSPASVDHTPPRRQSWKFTTPSWHRIRGSHHPNITRLLGCIRYGGPRYFTLHPGKILNLVLLVQPWTGYDHSWFDVFKSSRSGQTNPAPWLCFSVCLRVQSSVHCRTSRNTVLRCISTPMNPAVRSLRGVARVFGARLKKNLAPPPKKNVIHQNLRNRLNWSQNLAN